VYIAKFPDGYRVSDCSAIDNIDYYPVGSSDRKATLKDYFGQSPLFKTEDEAYKYALEINKGGWTEYGICSLNGTYENW
jgi:hypothetical protein